MTCQVAREVCTGALHNGTGLRIELRVEEEIDPECLGSSQKTFRVVETPHTRENPSCYLNPNLTLGGRNHAPGELTIIRRMSSLSVDMFPVTNSAAQTGNCIMRTHWLYDSTWLDMPARGRASIFPRRMEHQNVTAINYGIAVVMDGVNKLIDGIGHTHLFQKFWIFKASN